MEFGMYLLKVSNSVLIPNLESVLKVKNVYNQRLVQIFALKALIFHFSTFSAQRISVRRGKHTLRLHALYLLAHHIHAPNFTSAACCLSSLKLYFWSILWSIYTNIYQPKSAGSRVCFVICSADVVLGSWTNKVVILQHFLGSVLWIGSVEDELAALPLACSFTLPSEPQLSYQAVFQFVLSVCVCVLSLFHSDQGSV